jgi:tRNA G37 N-methylase Trm5
MDEHDLVEEIYHLCSFNKIAEAIELIYTEIKQARRDEREKIYRIIENMPTDQDGYYILRSRILKELSESP